MPDSNTVYNALPGLSVSLGSALSELASMWAPVDDTGKRSESEYRASRMNLIVHIGVRASVQEASALFDTVISFSHRYPCRMVVLCPQQDSWDSDSSVDCKIFSECVFGAGSSGMNCCEALIIGYTLSNREYLENQVSVFLEADLPTYYWPTRFASAAMLSKYQSFLSKSERVLFDSSLEEFAISEVQLERAENLHDLAFSRLLPMRQSIGQFLSSFQVEQLVDGLNGVKLHCGTGFSGEGRALLAWLESSLKACYVAMGSAMEGVALDQLLEDGEAGRVRICFEYSSQKYAEFDIDLQKGETVVEADFGSGRQGLTMGARLLDPEAALGEALFFS